MANDVQEKLEMISVKLTSILPLRAAHLYEWLYNSHNVSASLRHLMAGSRRWLLRAVNTYICTLVWMLPAPLPVAFIPSLPFSGKFCSPCACLLRIIAGEGQCLSSELVSSQDVSQQARELTALPGWTMQRCASAVPAFAHTGISNDFYINSTPGGSITCSSACELDLNKHNMQQSVEFSQ